MHLYTCFNFCPQTRFFHQIKDRKYNISNKINLFNVALMGRKQNLQEPLWGLLLCDVPDVVKVIKRETPNDIMDGLFKKVKWHYGWVFQKG